MLHHQQCRGLVEQTQALIRLLEALLCLALAQVPVQTFLSFLIRNLWQLTRTQKGKVQARLGKRDQFLHQGHQGQALLARPLDDRHLPGQQIISRLGQLHQEFLHNLHVLPRQGSIHIPRDQLHPEYLHKRHVPLLHRLELILILHAVLLRIGLNLQDPLLLRPDLIRLS